MFYRCSYLGLARIDPKELNAWSCLWSIKKYMAVPSVTSVVVCFAIGIVDIILIAAIVNSSISLGFLLKRIIE